MRCDLHGPFHPATSKRFYKLAQYFFKPRIMKGGLVFFSINSKVKKLTFTEPKEIFPKMPYIAEGQDRYSVHHSLITEKKEIT